MSWLALWDSRTLTYKARNARFSDMTQGALVAELALRAETASALPLWQSRDRKNPLRLTRQTDGQISLDHPRGYLETKPGFMFADEPLRIVLRWDAKGNFDLLSLRNLDTGERFEARLGAFGFSSLEQIVSPTPDTRLSIRYAAIGNKPCPVEAIGGLSADLTVQTPSGPARAGDLRTGMRVLSAEKGPQTIRWIGQSSYIARGSFAPVRLRAPFFGLQNDILVSRKQRLLLSGDAVEYLFGTEAVLAEAQDILRKNAAQLDISQPTQNFVHILLDDHDCLTSGKCHLDTALLSDVLGLGGHEGTELDLADSTPHLPVIDRASAQSYLSMLMQNRKFAA